MSFAPATISAVAAYWVAHGGLNGGIVGSLTSHCRGYHLGKDRIYGMCACKPSGVCKAGLGANDYSVQQSYDKAGLTNAAAALDLSWALADKSGLRAFSGWLIEQIRAGAADTTDICEFVYSLDGVNVYGWHRRFGVASAPILGYGDSSHRWHSHTAWKRDSETRDKLAVFRRYFEHVTVEDDVYPVPLYVPGQVATITDPTGPANIRAAPKPTATILRAIPMGISESWLVIGYVKGEYSAFGSSDLWMTRWNVDHWEYTAKGNVATLGSPVDATPYDLADVNAAITADRAKARIVYA